MRRAVRPVEGAKNANYSVGRGATRAVPTPVAADRRRPARPLTAKGFTEVTVLQDEPGAHEVSVADPGTGARVVFGTKTGTILSLYGGCFLLEDRG